MSKKIKLSPWFDGRVKPVHVGVYQFKDGKSFWYRKWNGKVWMCGDSSIAEAYTSSYQYGFFDSHEKWRGIVK